MDVKRNAVMTAGILAVVVSATGWGKRQQQRDEKTPSEAKSLPEMERLKFYRGEWDYTETYPKTAFHPNGSKNTGEGATVKLRNVTRLVAPGKLESEEYSAMP